MILLLLQGLSVAAFTNYVLGIRILLLHACLRHLACKHSPGGSYLLINADMTLQTEEAVAEGLLFAKIFFNEHTFQNRSRL